MNLSRFKDNVETNFRNNFFSLCVSNAAMHFGYFNEMTFMDGQWPCTSSHKSYKVNEGKGKKVVTARVPIEKLFKLVRTEGNAGPSGQGKSTNDAPNGDNRTGSKKSQQQKNSESSYIHEGDNRSPSRYTHEGNEEDKWSYRTENDDAAKRYSKTSHVTDKTYQTSNASSDSEDSGQSNVKGVQFKHRKSLGDFRGSYHSSDSDKSRYRRGTPHHHDLGRYSDDSDHSQRLSGFSGDGRHSRDSNRTSGATSHRPSEKSTRRSNDTHKSRYEDGEHEDPSNFLNQDINDDINEEPRQPRETENRPSHFQEPYSNEDGRSHHGSLEPGEREERRPYQSTHHPRESGSYGDDDTAGPRIKRGIENDKEFIEHHPEDFEIIGEVKRKECGLLCQETYECPHGCGCDALLGVLEGNRGSKGRGSNTVRPIDGDRGSHHSRDNPYIRNSENNNPNGNGSRPSHYFGNPSNEGHPHDGNDNPGSHHEHHGDQNPIYENPNDHRDQEHHNDSSKNEHHEPQNPVGHHSSYVYGLPSLSDYFRNNDAEEQGKHMAHHSSDHHERRVDSDHNPKASSKEKPKVERGSSGDFKKMEKAPDMLTTFRIAAQKMDKDGRVITVDNHEVHRSYRVRQDSDVVLKIQFKFAD